MKDTQPWYDYHHTITIYDKGFCWKYDKTLKEAANPYSVGKYIFTLCLWMTVLGLLTNA